MNHYKHLLFTFLLVVCAQIAHSLPKNIPEIFTKKQERLMVSDLPAPLLKKWPQLRPLSYASHHTVFDTTIVLKEEHGSIIKYKNQFNPSKQYTLIKTDSIFIPSNSIWFFSPEGSNQEDTPISIKDKCTFEEPCKELTQKLIDEIHQYDRFEVRLWLASGTYDLSNQNQQNNKPLLNLYNNMSVVGRSSDFRHLAYAQERPLIKGTLSWNDYIKHALNIYGEIKNIRVHTNDNTIQVEEDFVNTNIHTTGNLSISDCEFLKKNNEKGSNIVAENLFIQNTQLSSMGGRAANILANGLAGVANELYVEGVAPYNIKLAKPSVLIDYFSELTLKDLRCGLGGAAIYGGDSFLLFRIDGMKISAKSMKKCGSTNSFLWGIYINLDENDMTMSPSIKNTEINIHTNHGSAAALTFRNAPLKLTNTKIDISSPDRAYAIAGSKIVFTRKPSTIHVVAADPLIYFDFMPIEVKNYNSSQCMINNQSSTTC
jgi:hypothetical protein